MRTFAFLIILAILPLAGCEPPGSQTPMPSPSQMKPPRQARDMIEQRQMREADINELIFRDQFKELPSNLREKVSFFFLSLDGKDPSDEFMKRFEGNDPPVKKESECVVSSLEGGQVQIKDKETDEEGVKFRVHVIFWKTPEKGEVEVSYYASGQPASTRLYRISRDGDKWIVK
ncbi:MAG: hypothetical protein GTO55_09825 [Armatimonadetes bacterium]|nr:hypothetical protein [Armatimonadota bacterium]NIM24542.1 hypothetical protein [Armatimonadota bacterium]NIM68416.1 hypothetical protein [Armatimonadota bacterium]NIM76802.1 hypothetical protein [Armatimonadota bacterium]NIN06615.1 hypothetical protein [Armatimonadota bacterium]